MGSTFETRGVMDTEEDLDVGDGILYHMSRFAKWALRIIVGGIILALICWILFF